MEIFMLEISSIVRSKDEGHTITQMEILMMGNGREMRSMGKDGSHKRLMEKGLSRFIIMEN